MVEHCPIIVAANRDEHYDRPSTPPALWDTDPRILAGRDLRAGGTWLGVNEYGLLVGILNRRSGREPDPLIPTRSRGLLCRDLLNHESAAAAAEFVRMEKDPYQPFTLLFADPGTAWIAYNLLGEIKTLRLNAGLHVYSNGSEFDVRSQKVDRAYARFAQVVEGLPPNGDDKSAWVSSLRSVLGDHTSGNGSSDPRDAICVHGEISGTVSSSIIFYSQSEHRFYTFTSPGPPCQTVFGEAVALNVR